MLKVSDRTVLLSVKVPAAYRADYASDEKTPVDCISAWIRKIGGDDALVYVSRPHLVTTEDRHISAVVRVKRTKEDALLKASGQAGIFARPFRNVEDQPDTDKYSILWLEQNTELAEALTKAAQHEQTFGLAQKEKRLGVRVLKEDVTELAPKFLSAEEAAVAGAVMWDITNVPPFLTKEMLQKAMAVQLEWKCIVVSERQAWGKKSFRVKSNDTPRVEQVKFNNDMVTDIKRHVFRPKQQRIQSYKNNVIVHKRDLHRKPAPVVVPPPADPVTVPPTASETPSADPMDVDPSDAPAAPTADPVNVESTDTGISGILEILKRLESNVDGINQRLVTVEQDGHRRPRKAANVASN